MKVRIAAILFASVFALVACGGEGGEEASETPSAAAAGGAATGPAKAKFASPKAGAKVKSPVKVKMKAANIQITESGALQEGSGHFHVMVDTKCVAEGKPIPEDAKHVHYGDASTSAKLKLKSGKHTLCLQLGDGAHAAVGKTDKVKITVK